MRSLWKASQVGFLSQVVQQSGDAWSVTRDTSQPAERLIASERMTAPKSPELTSDSSPNSTETMALSP